MIPKSLLLGMLKPLLPKLEGFLKNHPDLQENEEANVVLKIENDEIVIKIYGFKIEDGKITELRLLQSVDAKEL